jgi:hypothetical protein
MTFHTAAVLTFIRYISIYVYTRIHNWVCAFSWLLIRSNNHHQGSTFGEVSNLNGTYAQSLIDDFHNLEKAHTAKKKKKEEKKMEEEEEEEEKKMEEEEEEEKKKKKKKIRGRQRKQRT